MKINRRSFLAGLGAAGAALGADAFGLEATRVVVTRHDLRVPNLPGSMDGIRIAQVSDVHLPGNQLAAQAALEHVHRERPEIVVLSGDMTERLEAAGQVREFAANARGSLATVAILGNWEYYSDMVGEAARNAYRGTGVDLLINQSKVVSLGSSFLALIGLDDVLLGRPDLRTARKDLRPGTMELWLVHEPMFADMVPLTFPARPIMLMAGHTHGGQIRIPFLPPIKPTGAGRFLEGWYRDTVAPLYVTHGVGTTGIPARFRCAAELPIFTLRPA
ncbi:MAG TPA: metallophosphoesterase [Gemmatimonadales bacterium]|nr:metallophosphoesterase [Gemmatimonadales bacterium]